MNTLTLENHVSKTEAAQVYRRGLRSITRDIGKALSSRDESVLNNWRLKTSDGVIKQGTDVTTEEVEALHSQGMVPTWWGFKPYLESKYGRRDAPEPQAKKTSDSNPEQGNAGQSGASSANSTSGSSEEQAPFALVEPLLPEDQSIRSIVLEHHHYLNAKREHELSAKEARIDKLTDRVLDLVENNQSLQAQSNKIANAFQEYIKGEGKSPADAISETSSTKQTNAHSTNKEVTPAEIIEVKPTEPTEINPNKHQKTKPKKEVATKQLNTKKTVKKHRSQPKKAKAISANKKGTWLKKNLPTFFGN